MRSRDVRPFTVEFKTKRRTPAVLPPSLWGEAAALFKAVPDRPDELPRQRGIDPVITMQPKGVQPDQAARARRILPDLRTFEVAAEEAIAPARVKRISRRRGGNIMQHDTEKQGEHQTETASSVQIAEPVAAIHIETSSLAISAEGGEAVVAQQTDAQAEAPEEVISVAVSSPIVVPEAPLQPSRRWAKQAADLPRWEKWKRRLPDVCR